MLTHDTAEQVREEDYPETWQQGEGLTFPISYHFEPGSADDGLTIDVPVATLNRVDADDFSWNVPGVRHELVTSLIRSLPKNLRVSFVPAPDKAREFLAATPPGEEPLLDALERWARSTTGVVVPREAWDWSKVPPHLQPTYRVLDDEGDEQARGKDLDALKAPLEAQFDAALAAVAGRQRVRRHRPDRLDLRLAADRDPAAPGRPRGAGLSRPCSTRARPSVSGCSAPPRRRRPATGTAYAGCWCVSSPSAPTRPSASTPPSGSGWPARRTPRWATCSTTCGPRSSSDVVDAHPPVRTPEEYAALVAAGRDALAARGDQVLLDVLRVLADWRDTDRALSGRAELVTLPALQDMREQLARLVGPRVPGRGRSRPAAPLPDVPPGDPASSRAAGRPGRCATVS